MDVDKILSKAAAVAIIVELVFWLPLSVAWFVPYIHANLPFRLANLVSLYVGLLPILVFLSLLLYVMVKDKK